MFNLFMSDRTFMLRQPSLVKLFASKVFNVFLSVILLLNLLPASGTVDCAVDVNCGSDVDV